MQTWIAWTIAVLCLAAFLALWFCDVRRIMRDRKSTVESAQGQLTTCRKNAGGEEVEQSNALLERSERIYRQAVDLYNRTMRKPWIYLPARLMHYHFL